MEELTAFLDSQHAEQMMPSGCFRSTTRRCGCAAACNPLQGGSSLAPDFLKLAVKIATSVLVRIQFGLPLMAP
jgi:hypothetical protein